ncbi:MAG: hypothetical protein JEZ06_01710 [Anaerolineaceae bacterium]|nr:hypothetical protein [Anaerolineaceae bacterium]
MRTKSLIEAVDLIHEGERDKAADLLQELVSNDPGNAKAWLWLSIAVNSKEAKIECLKKVLELDPENQKARIDLFQLSPDADAIPEPSLEELLSRPA